MVFSILEKYRTICDNLLKLEYRRWFSWTGKRATGPATCFTFSITSSPPTRRHSIRPLQCGTFSPFSVLMMPSRTASPPLQVSGRRRDDRGQAVDLGLVPPGGPPRRAGQRTEEVLRSAFGPQLHAVVSLAMGNIRRRKLDLFNNWADSSTTDYLNLLMDFEDYNEGMRPGAKSVPRPGRTCDGNRKPFFRRLQLDRHRVPC